MAQAALEAASIVFRVWVETKLPIENEYAPARENKMPLIVSALSSTTIASENRAARPAIPIAEPVRTKGEGFDPKSIQALSGPSIAAKAKTTATNPLDM